MREAFLAVELGDLDGLRRLLDEGFDINTEDEKGWTLLHLAIDVESDGAAQTGKPLHVDATALLLARGADPDRRAEAGGGPTARMLALQARHWLAVELMERIRPE